MHRRQWFTGLLVFYLSYVSKSIDGNGTRFSTQLRFNVLDTSKYNWYFGQEDHFIDDSSEYKFIYVPSCLICREKTIFDERWVLIIFPRKCRLGMSFSWYRVFSAENLFNCGDLKPHQQSFLLRAANYLFNFKEQLISFVRAKCFVFVLGASIMVIEQSGVQFGLKSCA